MLAAREYRTPSDTPDFKLQTCFPGSGPAGAHGGGRHV